MFDNKSRYKNLPTQQVEDARGRQVKVVVVPAAPQQRLLGYHLLKQGQRLDHLAEKYLKNPSGFWQIAEANDVMLPEVLGEQSEIAIPEKIR